jgi:DNA-binding NarL/FixJ family response regulator
MWWAIAALAVCQLLLSWFVIRKIRKLTAVSQEQTDKETRVFKLYAEIESMLDSFEQYVSEVHSQMENERTGMTELSRRSQVALLQGMERLTSVEKMMSPAQDVPAPPPPPEIVPPSSSRLPTKDKQNLDKLEGKNKKVRFLMSCGLSVDEVAKELDIGIGEVRLIVDLNRD